MIFWLTTSLSAFKVKGAKPKRQNPSYHFLTCEENQEKVTKTSHAFLEEKWEEEMAQATNGEGPGTTPKRLLGKATSWHTLWRHLYNGHNIYGLPKIRPNIWGKTQHLFPFLFSNQMKLFIGDPSQHSNNTYANSNNEFWPRPPNVLLKEKGEILVNLRAQKIFGKTRGGLKASTMWQFSLLLL